MEGKRKAAIDLDEVLERPLDGLSAVEFLQVLSHPKLSASHRQILADKKKYELWVDEGTTVTVSVGELLDKIRGEKKKLEYEIPPWINFIPENGLRKQLDYGSLAEDVAERVTMNLRRA
jgi:hypothetical protein